MSIIKEEILIIIIIKWNLIHIETTACGANNHVQMLHVPIQLRLLPLKLYKTHKKKITIATKRQRDKERESE